MVYNIIPIKKQPYGFYIKKSGLLKNYLVVTVLALLQGEYTFTPLMVL